jgi:hypothetical protein
MPQHDIDNGRLVCVIGAAPVKPAEFVIFRIQRVRPISGDFGKCSCHGCASLGLPPLELRS